METCVLKSVTTCLTIFLWLLSYDTIRIVLLDSAPWGVCGQWGKSGRRLTAPGCQTIQGIASQLPQNTNHPIRSPPGGRSPKGKTVSKYSRPLFYSFQCVFVALQRSYCLCVFACGSGCLRCFDARWERDPSFSMYNYVGAFCCQTEDVSGVLLGTHGPRGQYDCESSISTFLSACTWCTRCTPLNSLPPRPPRYVFMNYCRERLELFLPLTKESGEVTYQVKCHN